MNVTEPTAGLDAADEGGHGRSFQFAGFEQLGQTASHDVNVFNAAELEFNILVKVLVLVAFAGGPVSHGIDLIGHKEGLIKDNQSG